MAGELPCPYAVKGASGRSPKSFLAYICVGQKEVRVDWAGHMIGQDRHPAHMPAVRLTGAGRFPGVRFLAFGSACSWWQCRGGPAGDRGHKPFAPGMPAQVPVPRSNAPGPGVQRISSVVDSGVIPSLPGWKAGAFRPAAPGPLTVPARRDAAALTSGMESPAGCPGRHRWPPDSVSRSPAFRRLRMY